MYDALKARHRNDCVSRLLTVGIVGTIVSALCCFTPVLVIALGAIGLSGMVGMLDYVLIPLLIAFIVLTVIAVIRMRKEKNNH